MRGLAKRVMAGVCALCLVAAGMAAVAWARDFKDVSFPDQCVIAGKTCPLVGIGVRKKFFFTIYYGALYMAQPSHDARQVVAAQQPKRIIMHVIYHEISPSKWVDGWKDGFAITAPHPGSQLQGKIMAFLNCFDEPVRKGERVVITYVPERGTVVEIKGKTKATIAGSDFMIALWSIWFGEEPVSQALMEGMLGK